MDYFDDYIILPSSIKGDKIITRDFKDKTILFRVEINSLINEDLDYLDGQKGYYKMYVTNLYIVTKEFDDYILHNYYGGAKETFQRSSRYSFWDTAKYKYDKCSVIKISSFDPKIDAINDFYSVALLSKMEPLIKSIKPLLFEKEKHVFKERNSFIKDF